MKNLTATSTYSRSLTPFVGTGNFRDFQTFAEQHGLGDIYAETEPYKDKLPHWLGVSDGNKILAITPYQDDSSNFGQGNRRVKPSSEITPFAVDPEAADALIQTWETAFPKATRYGNIRVPVADEQEQKSLAIVGVAEALRKQGYGVEAVNECMFFVAGRYFDAKDYAKVAPERLALFPERDEEWFRTLQERIESKKSGFRPEVARRAVERIKESHNLRQARPNDVPQLVYVLTETFPFYGTYNLAEVMPELVAAQFTGSAVPSLVYVAERKSDGAIDATVTVERSPFRFGELTDVAALDPDTGHVKTNGVGFALSYEALRHAGRMGMRTWWTDAVPAPEMNSLANKLGGGYAGIHRATVKLLTKQIKARHFPHHDPLVMDLFVHNGPVEQLDWV